MTKTKSVFWVYGNRRQCQGFWDGFCKFIHDNTGEHPNVETIVCGFNQTIYTENQRWCTAKDVIYALRTKDMFDARPRIIKVLGIPEDYKDLSDHLRMPPRCSLVFWGRPGYFKPGSSKWATLKTSTLYKTVKEKGRIYEFPFDAASDSAAMKHIKAVCEDEKKSISQEVAQEIVRLEGRNLDMLENTAWKLCLHATGKKILPEDVKACCRKEFLDKVWDYISFLDESDVVRSLQYLQAFYNEELGVGESFTGRVNMMFGALRQHFLFLVLAKDACPNGIQTSAIEKSIKGFKKITTVQLNKMAAGSMTADALLVWFTSGFLYANMNNQKFLTALKQQKSRIYNILLDLYFCMFLCRTNPSESYMKLCLDTFTSVACGELTPQQAAQARGHRRKYEV